MTTLTTEQKLFLARLVPELIAYDNSPPNTKLFWWLADGGDDSKWVTDREWLSIIVDEIEPRLKDKDWDNYSELLNDICWTSNPRKFFESISATAVQRTTAFMQLLGKDGKL